MNGKQKLLLFFGILFFQLLLYLFLSNFDCEEITYTNFLRCMHLRYFSNTPQDFPDTPIYWNNSVENYTNTTQSLLITISTLLTTTISPKNIASTHSTTTIAPKTTSSTLSTTVLPIPITIDDITITVKSTKKYHKERIGTLLKTWMKRVINQTYVVTDDADANLQTQLPENHLVSTKCGKSHARNDLCCKTSKEFDVYLQTNKRWWCHVDDDAYVNVENLLQLLSNYDPDKQKIYLGRKSNPNKIISVCYGSRHTYYFFAGGSYCISRKAAIDMAPKVQRGKLVEVCGKCDIADDLAIAIAANVFAGATEVESFLFHSIYDKKPPETHKKYSLEDQITFVPDKNARIKYNNLTKLFDSKVDPRGYFSLHCTLYPKDEICIEKLL